MEALSPLNHATLHFDRSTYTFTLAESEEKDSNENSTGISPDTHLTKVEYPAYLFRHDFVAIASHGFEGYFWPYTASLSAGNNGQDDSTQRYLAKQV